MSKTTTKTTKTATEKATIEKVKPVKKVVKEEPAPEAPEAPAPEAQAPETPAPEAPVQTQEPIQTQIGKVAGLVKTLKDVQNNLKDIAKKAKKSKQEEKEKTKRVVSEEERQRRRETSGFNKPVEVSQALATFMGLKEPKASRTDVTRFMCAYIKDNKLQQGRSFSVDEKLKALLGEAVFPVNSKQPELGNGYTYFSLPKYLSSHFVKKIVV